MKGAYAVVSLMFNMNKKRQKFNKAAEKEQSPQKLISNGDMFGEVALLYGCRRTATVMSMQYNTCAYLTF